jgi:hypothetical protein
MRWKAGAYGEVTGAGVNGVPRVHRHLLHYNDDKPKNSLESKFGRLLPGILRMVAPLCVALYVFLVDNAATVTGFTLLIA